MERLVAWYRVSSSIGAVAALIMANAVPLLGVLSFGWSVWTILIVYWLENGIVGGFNVLKMVLAQGDGAGAPLARSSAAQAWRINGRAADGMAKAALIPFFIVHYGIFWLVHGVFVFALPAFGAINPGAISAPDPSTDPALLVTPGMPGPDLWTIVFAVLALFASHGASFLFNYLRGGEYKRTTAAGQMFAPYGRLVILHVTIIFGALAISFTGAPNTAVVILVALKTAMDLAFHLREHRGGTTPLAIPG